MRAAAIGAVLVTLEACGGGGGMAAPDGAAGNGGGGGGLGGSGAAAGAGSGGHAAGGAGRSGGLPACAIATRPQDPTGTIDSMTPNACNSIPALTSDALLGEECFVPSSDGGVAPDGGMLQLPVGGTIQDGDYVLVRDQVSADNCFGQDPGPPSRARSIRVFGGGTYFEWVQSDLQGTATQAWWDATGSTSGVIFTFSETCGSATLPATVGFTATSDELTLFFYGNQSFENGPLHIITTYRRTCAR